MARQTRDELDRRVAALRDQMPEVLALEEKDQMEGFAGIAEGILEDAGPEDHEHVWSQLQCILRGSGLVPGHE